MLFLALENVAESDRSEQFEVGEVERGHDLEEKIEG
jgi:hypothetical protein